MKEIIQKLDVLLSNARPEFYEGLNEPLSDNEISSLEKKFDVKLPDDLKTLYKWKNGQSEDNFEAFVNNSMFVSLEEALETCNDYSEMIGVDFEIENWWNEKWIPIFHNGGGDHICYDLKGLFTGNQGQMIEFWQADPDRNVIAPNLSSFLAKVNEYYEENQEEDFDEFFEIDGLDDYPKVFIVK